MINTNVEKQVETEMHINGLVMKDVYDRDKWREVVKLMTVQNPTNSVNGEETGSKLNR